MSQPNAPVVDNDLRAAMQAAVTQQPAAQAPAVENVDTDPGDDVEKLKAEIAKWKANSRKNETEKKANAEKARLFDELQEAQKTETQKLADAKAAAERDAAAAKLEVARVTVAAAKGVPAALLSGTTKEEMEASADALLAWAGKRDESNLDLGQGDRGAPAANSDPNAWLRNAVGAGRRSIFS